MSKQRIHKFLILGIYLIILVNFNQSKSIHSHQHQHHKHDKNPHPPELLEKGEYESFIQHFSLPFFDLNKILGLFNSDAKVEEKEKEPKAPIAQIIPTASSKSGISFKTDITSTNENKWGKPKKREDTASKHEHVDLKHTPHVKETRSKEKSSSEALCAQAKNPHHKFYSDLNKDYIRSRRQHICNEDDLVKPAIQEVGKNEINGDDFSLEGNIKEINKHLVEMKAEKEKDKKDEVEKTKKTQILAAEKPNNTNKNNNFINNNFENSKKENLEKPIPSASTAQKNKNKSCSSDNQEASEFKDQLKSMNIFEPCVYSKKHYDMNACEDTLSERLKAFNGKKSFNKESNNVAIAKANNSYAVAKGIGPGKAIASSTDGGAATAISLGGGDAISEVKHHGRATAISHGRGSSTAKSHDQGVSEAISKGDGKALAISSDNSYSRAVAIGNSNSTALSSDNATAISTANSQALSDADAKKNSTAVANATSRANSLAVATDNAFANATANANSVALSTACQNSIANSNANSDAEALAKASGNSITQVLANANSQAIAESKDNSVVIVESNANSTAIGVSESPTLPGGPMINIKPKLQLRGSDFNHNYPSFLMIKKIELPSFQNNRNMFDYLNMNMDDDASLLVNANNHGGIFSSIFGGNGASLTQNATTCPKDVLKSDLNQSENLNKSSISPICSASEATKEIIQAAAINIPVIPPFNESGSHAEIKPVLTTESIKSPITNDDLKPDKQKLSDSNTKIDLSKMDTQSDFVKDLVRKINNEDCILNYDAGPIFNSYDKKPETASTPANNDYSNRNSLQNPSPTANAEEMRSCNALEKRDQNAELQQQQQQQQQQRLQSTIDNSLTQANQACASEGKDQIQAIDNKAENENKSFLKATEKGTDKNKVSSDPCFEGQNINLTGMPGSADGMNIDKQNNRILVDDSDGKNRKIKVNQSLNFSKNQVNKSFNCQNSDFKMKNSVENLSDKEAKCGQHSEPPAEAFDHEHEDEKAQDHDSEEDQDFDLAEGFEDDEEDRKHRGEKSSKLRKGRRSRRDAKSKRASKSRGSADEPQEDDFAEFDKKYFNSGSSKKGKSKGNRDSGRRSSASAEKDTLNGYEEDKKALREARQAQQEQQQKSNKTDNNCDSGDEIEYNKLKEKIRTDKIIDAKCGAQSDQKACGASADQEFNKLKSAVSSEATKNKINSIWTNTAFKAVDIACSNKGDIMAIGEDKKLYRYDLQSNSFSIMKQEDELSNLKSIDLGSDATPFAITKNGNTYFLDSKSNWIRLPGCATDISIGKEGEIFKLGCTNRPRGYSIYQFICSIEEESTMSSNTSNKIKKNLDSYLKNYYKNLNCEWKRFPGFASSIVVGNDGSPIIISKKNNFVYKSDGKYWDAVSGVKAKDISVSNENVLFIVGMDGKIYEVFNDKDSSVVLFDSIAAEKISTGPYSRPSIIKSCDGVVYTSSKI